MTRSRWMLLAACVVAVAAIVAWRWTRTTTAPARPRPSTSARVRRVAIDVQKYRAMRQALLDKAKDLAAKRAAFPPRAENPLPAAPPPSAPPNRPPTSSLISPACKVGPTELCDTIAEIVDDCDASDGQACLAVAQLLADTPPRSVLARVFLQRACEAGEQEACARMRLLDGTDPVACDEDVFACGYRAFKSSEPVALDDACSRGFAEACVQLVPIRGGDRTQARAYLEHGCQLGDPNACEGLGFMLSDECDDPELCFDHDPQQSAAAYAIACAAGWESACNK